MARQDDSVTVTYRRLLYYVLGAIVVLLASRESFLLGVKYGKVLTRPAPSTVTTDSQDLTELLDEIKTNVIKRHQDVSEPPAEEDAGVEQKEEEVKEEEEEEAQSSEEGEEEEEEEAQEEKEEEDEEEVSGEEGSEETSEEQEESKAGGQHENEAGVENADVSAEGSEEQQAEAETLLGPPALSAQAPQPKPKALSPLLKKVPIRRYPPPAWIKDSGGWDKMKSIEYKCLGKVCGKGKVCAKVNGKVKCTCPVGKRNHNGACVQRNPELPPCIGVISGKVTAGQLDLPELKNHNVCSVVGNSQVLLRRPRGKEIMLADTIFRFNDAPTLGKQASVGSRTTVRIHNRMHCGEGESGEYCFFYSQENTNTGHEKACMRSQQKPKPNCKSLPMLRSVLQFVQGYWLKHPAPRRTLAPVPKPSAGFFGVVLALSTCGKVNMFGFTPGRTGHYYKKTGNKSGGVKGHHSWQAESACLKELMASNVTGVTWHQ